MYYKVYVKCGHVGINYCIYVWMAVEAQNKKEAAQIARWLPRVKHHHKDAIVSVVRIDKDEYEEILNDNLKDPYLNCHSVQDQNRIEDLYERIEIDAYNNDRYKKPEDDRVLSVYKNKLVRNVHKYAKYNNYFEQEDYTYVN